MLRIYIDEVDNKELNIIHDVEAAFSKIRLTGSDTEKKLIDKIEQGRYNDE